VKYTDNMIVNTIDFVMFYSVVSDGIIFSSIFLTGKFKNIPHTRYINKIGS